MTESGWEKRKIKPIRKEPPNKKVNLSAQVLDSEPNESLWMNDYGANSLEILNKMLQRGRKQ